MNNPSNPCGSVFSEAHLRKVLEFAERHKIPIISDEIYANIVFDGFSFTSIADLSENVPILAISGIAKEFLVPGWR